MPGDACIVCGNSRKEPLLSYHRFPSNPEKRAMWICELQLSEDVDGLAGCDTRNKPELSLGKRFGSCTKKGAPRTKRVS